MKKLFISTAVLFIISTAGYAKKVDIFANSGLSFPSFSEEFLLDELHWKAGYNLGMGLEYSILPFSLVSIRGNFDYNNFKLDTDKYKDGDASILLISGGIKIAPPIPGFPLKPYLVGGAGFFQFLTEDIKDTTLGISIRTGDSESALSLAFSAGVDFSFIPLIDLFVEGNYVIGFTENENTKYFPVKVGLRIGI